MLLVYLLQDLASGAGQVLCVNAVLEDDLFGGGLQVGDGHLGLVGLEQEAGRPYVVNQDVRRDNLELQALLEVQGRGLRSLDPQLGQVRRLRFQHEPLRHRLGHAHHHHAPQGVVRVFHLVTVFAVSRFLHEFAEKRLYLELL